MIIPAQCQAGSHAQQPGGLKALLFLLLLPPVQLQGFYSTIAGGLHGTYSKSDLGVWPGLGEFSGRLSSGVETEEAPK